MERVQPVITMVRQSLGLDNDRSDGEVILGFLLLVFQSNGVTGSRFKFSEFLDEVIHVQLVNVST